MSVVLLTLQQMTKEVRRAVVVGASSGIGREISRLLAGRGWHTGIMARRGELLSELRDMCPERVTMLTCDVTGDDAADRLLRLVDMMGGIDLLVYSSGYGRHNMALDADMEMTTVKTNAEGFTRMVDAAYLYMAGHGGGHIAVISSVAGTRGLGAAPSYSATKAFQQTYIQALEQQARMRRLPITFTDIRPGFVDTPFMDGNGRYPMFMDVRRVARSIVRAIEHRRHVCVIDWRYRILVALWRLIPDCLWRRMTFLK